MKFLLLAFLLASPAIAEQYDPKPEPTRCSLQVSISFDRDFDNGDSAQDYCEDYEDSCVVRRHGDIWESSFRLRRTFISKNARDVLSLFDRFIRRSDFVGDRFVTSLKFKNCRG